MRRLAVLIAGILTACADAALEPSGITGQPGTGPTGEPALALQADVSPFEVTGSGPLTSEPFALAGGSTIFRLTRASTESCTVRLEDPVDGTLLWTVFTTEGPGSEAAGSGAPGSETRLMGLARGAYRFSVATEGLWSIRVEQPREEEAIALDSLSGSDNGLFGPFRIAKAPMAVSVTYPGTASFAVNLLTPTGHLAERVVQASGSLQVHKVLAAKPGVYFLDVAAEGPWDLRRE